jgi:hypothetical protein
MQCYKRIANAHTMYGIGSLRQGMGSKWINKYLGALLHLYSCKIEFSFVMGKIPQIPKKLIAPSLLF